MKTATIDYEDFETFVGLAIGTVAMLEQTIPLASGEAKEKAEKGLTGLRATLERVSKTAVVGVRAATFQDRLDAAIAAARANK